MTEWLIEMGIASDDREAIEQLLSGTGVALVDSGEMTLLRDPRMDAIADVDAAKAFAERLVRHICALVQVLSGRTGPTTSRLWWRMSDGRLRTTVAATLTPTYNILANVDMAEWSGLLVLAGTDDRVARVLDIAGRGVTQLDWHGLYVLLDAIAEDSGDLRALQDHGWASKRELDRFKHTANSYEALADAARHGHAGTPPDKPMSPGEAHRLLLRIVRGWLAWHRQQLS